MLLISDVVISSIGLAIAAVVIVFLFLKNKKAVK